MSFERVLQLIGDVEGVVGSFVANAAGHLVVQQVPPHLPKAALRRTALRVARIIHSAELCEMDVERCDFRFDGYQLLVWRFETGMLGVLSEAPFQRRALGMAARLALRELRSSWPPAAPQSSVRDTLSGAEEDVTAQYLTPEQAASSGAGAGLRRPRDAR
jgi:hypothetical protein